MVGPVASGRRVSALRGVVWTLSAALAATIVLIGGVPAQGQRVPVTTTASPLQLASWNFCNYTCADWQRRLGAFARTVRATRPDVLAVQEVDTRDGYLARTARALRPLGYVLADPSIHRTCPGGCESHLFVKTSRISVVPRRAGTVPTRLLPTSTNPVAYALLADRRTGRQFLALSLHLAKQGGTGLNGADDRDRNTAVSALARWAQTYAPEVPTAVLGDFNSYPRKQADGPHSVLQGFGYRNAEAARTTLGDQFATVNKTPADARWDGFPPRPRRFLLGGPRIDGILTKGFGPAIRYQVYIRTRADGRFAERFRASDHNMVRAWFRSEP